MSIWTVDITPARRIFSNRKQWKFSITAQNGEPIDPRDTYANVGDIFAVLQGLQYNALHVRVHYKTGVDTVVLSPGQVPF